MHIELLTASATAAATTGSAAAALAGDSLTIKNGQKSIDIMALWQTNQTAGFAQIVFPTAHDTQRGYRAGIAAGVNPAVLPFGVKMRVRAQEALAVTIAATAVAGDVENLSALIRYEEFAGLQARLITASQVESRMERMTTIENSLASTAGPSYGTGETFDQDSDLLLANRDYAIMGASCRTQVHAIWYQTPDQGNVRMGVPGVLRPEVTAQFNMLLSRVHGEPMVPIFNSGNKKQCTVGVVTDENAGTFVVTLYLALLK